MATPSSSEDENENGRDQDHSPFYLASDPAEELLLGPGELYHAPYDQTPTPTPNTTSWKWLPLSKPYYSVKITTLLRLFLLFASVYPILNYINVFNPSYLFSTAKFIPGMVVCGLDVLWNLMVLIGSCVGSKWKWRLVLVYAGGRGRVTEDRSLVDGSEDGLDREGKGHKTRRVMGIVLDIVLATALIGVTIVTYQVVRPRTWLFPVGAVVWTLVVGGIQLLIAFISAWPKIRDSRVAWVKLIFESEVEAEATIEPEILLDIESAAPENSAPPRNHPISLVTNPSQGTKTRTIPLFIVLRTLTLLIGIAVSSSLQPHRDYYLWGPPTKQLRFSISVSNYYNFFIIIAYFLATYHPQPSHLLKFVRREEDIDRVRTVKVGDFGGRGPVLADRGMFVLRRLVLVLDCVVGVMVWCGIGWVFMR